MILKKEILFFLLIIINVLNLSCSKINDKKSTGDNIRKQVGYPEIKFDTTYHDFGSLAQGEKVSFTFRFRNTGTSSLIIKDAYSTCGCTVPDYSKEPVSPGAEGKVDIVFDSDGKNGLQYKTITLKLNTKIKEKTLTIKANVV